MEDALRTLCYIYHTTSKCGFLDTPKRLHKPVLVLRRGCTRNKSVQIHTKRSESINRILAETNCLPVPGCSVICRRSISDLCNSRTQLVPERRTVFPCYKNSEGPYSSLTIASHSLHKPIPCSDPFEAHKAILYKREKSSSNLYLFYLHHESSLPLV